MKNLTKIVLVATFIMWTVGCGVSAAFAEIPRLINFQGKLADSDGKPITGTRDIAFRIYGVESGGTPLWNETQSVTIQKGIFNVLLGSSTDLNLPFDQPYWLEIKVGTDAPMTPRQRVTSAGYAFRAQNADKVGGKHASDFIEQGTPAGGDLTGTYPNPTIEAAKLSKSLVGFLPHFYGNGSDGTPNFSNGGTISTQILQYENLTIPSGQTVTCAQPITIIGVSGTCTIAGTLTAAGQGGSGGVGPGASTHGNDGVGGGGQAAHGTSASGGSDSYGWMGGAGGGGGGGGGGWGGGGVGGRGGGAGGAGGDGGSTGGNGGNGYAAATSKINALRFENRCKLAWGYGAGGGSGGGSDGSGSGAGGADGGNGGGSILILCKDLDFTGTIDVSGDDGNNGASGSGANFGGSGGGAGGGGGNLIIFADSITANTGSTNVSGGSGGTGGTGAGSGGKGGNGGNGVAGIVEIAEL